MPMAPYHRSNLIHNCAPVLTEFFPAAHYPKGWPAKLVQPVRGFGNEKPTLPSARDACQDR